MDRIENLPQIRAALMDKANVLRELSDQVYSIEIQIKNLAACISVLENFGSLPEAHKETPKIIPFPVPSKKNLKDSSRVLCPGSPGNHSYLVPVVARPGEPLPDSIPDFRPFLQRDGLILLSWDKKRTEKGDLYTAYWVTGTGTFRYFASAPANSAAFGSAWPDHKSYAAEDGVEFHGETPPCYVVHVAPELMMSLRGRTDERPCHIEKLKKLGVETDFNYKFLLTREKTKKIC